MMPLVEDEVPNDLDLLQENENAEPSPEELEREEAEKEKEDEERELELNECIKNLIKKAEDEDTDLRITPLNLWKRNDLYFNNIQNIFLDPVAHDYRTINTILDELTKQGVNLDIKVINVYRAYIESIVAALSVDLPTVEFAPDDADDPDDLETATAYGKISYVIQKHNHAALMLIKALVTLSNQGVIFGHRYRDNDPKYGSYSKVTGTKTNDVPVNDVRCGNCSQLIDSMVPDGQMQPGSMITCPECGYQGPPDIIRKIMQEDEPVSWENTPKGQTKFDIYGPTYVKAPLYAREQSKVGYLILRTEDHLAKFKTEYQDDELIDSHDSESFERWARLPIEYNGTVPMHLATKRTVWFRPWYYNELDRDNADILFEAFPHGMKACIIGETIVSKEPADIDDDWTISFDPRNNFIHAEPLGNAAVPIQDAENDTFNLGLQCIEFGVPETFAHPKTLNFQKYGESNAAPGMVSPALPYAPDKSIADGFHTIKPATLSSEYVQFEKGLENKGQFVTGAMASIFGGGATAGSKTADEYRQSRSQALQRLQIMWRIIKVFWSDLIYKCVIDFAANMREDEKYTEKKAGSYVNVVISKSSLLGKAGQVTPDMNEQLPQSWPQKRDFITSILEKAPEAVGEILMHPNNSDLLKQYTGISEIYIPGEKDVHKQTAEFKQMVTGLEVAIDIHVDDHAVHKLVLKDLLVGPEGMALDQDTYAICIEHYVQHDLAEKAKTMTQVGSVPQGTPPISAIQPNEGV